MHRVMVVDDEALVRSGLRMILGSAADVDVVATPCRWKLTVRNPGRPAGRRQRRGGGASCGPLEGAARQGGGPPQGRSTATAESESDRWTCPSAGENYSNRYSNALGTAANRAGQRRTSHASDLR